MKSGKQFELPIERRKAFIETVDGLNIFCIIGLGLAIYISTVFLFAGVEYFVDPKSHFPNSQTIENFWDLVYFNFISILTIGYGDLSPLGLFRLFTIIEAIIGLAIYSLMISVVTIKILLPRKNTVVFSKYAYYCTDDDSFLIIYLNTASQYLSNLETSWYFKLNQDWLAIPPIRVPFITKAVQTFYLGFKSFEEIKRLLHPLDCLRIGLSGSLGMSSYSTYVEYSLDDILVINNRSELTKYPGFWQVDQYLQTDEFREYFHYCPQGAQKLSSYLTQDVRS